MVVLIPGARPGKGIAERYRCRRRGAAVLAVLLVLAWLPAAALAIETGGKLTQEYDLKAAFLFNFAQFVEWPASAFSGTSTPITIGILGEDPFGNSIDEVVAQETAHGRGLLVRRYATVDQVSGCHILFIAASETDRVENILSSLARRGILTVGETKAFADHSGIITFQVKNHRLRLRINLAAARDARLTISSKLLRQSDIVGAQKVGP